MEEVELQISGNTDKAKEAQTVEQNGNHVGSPVIIESRKENGLTLWTAALFILGEMAGSGVLALPYAVLNAGWAGLVMITVFCATSAYSGTRLSICWILLEQRHEEYRKQVRNPYPSIGYRAYGKWMRMFVSACVNITLFGVGTVLLLLSARLVTSLMSHMWIISPCLWIIIIAVVLTPFMWLGTPKDFWPIAVGAAVTTGIACFMIIVRSMLEAGPTVPVEYPPPTFSSFFLAFGTILFSYGGASTFPTIQNDMKDRAMFSKSVSIAFVALALLYIPVAACGYILFGSNLKDNILDSLTKGPDMIVVEVLLASHLLFAFIIIINPFCQEFEQLLKVPNEFGWRRCLLRTSVMILIVFVGESVPHFGKILNLVGGSTITLLTFVFPPLFYMRLVDMKSPDVTESRQVKTFERIFLWLLVFIGISGGAAATYNSVWKIAAPDAFSLPCYVGGA